MKKKGFLVSKDGVKYACSYTISGKNFDADILDPLSQEAFSKDSLAQLELDDGTLRTIVGQMGTGSERADSGQMLVKDCSGTLN